MRIRRDSVLTTASNPSEGIKTTPWFLGWAALYGGAILPALGSAVIPLSITADEGLAKEIRWITEWWWFWGGVVALLGGLVWAIAGANARSNEVKALRAALGVAASDIERAAAESRAKTTEGIFHQLSPIIHDLGNLAESQSMHHGRDLVNRGLHLVTDLIDVEQVRACLYYLDHVESRNAASSDIANALTLRMPHVGRHDQPRPNFVRSESLVADQVFEVIDNGVGRLIEDVQDTEHAVDCQGKQYRTFLNVPVKFKTAEYGVLSVDAPVAKSLTSSHVLLASMVAQLLAVGLRREKKNNYDRNPRPSITPAETRPVEGPSSTRAL